MIALVCVDGTGPSLVINPAEYDKIYGSSSTSDVFHYWPGPKEYFRGPSVEGFETGSIADAAFASAKRLVATPGVTALFMVGHSRGCAALIDAAQQLEPLGITVNFMGFFDAVDMTTSVDATVVPANVLNVVHAMRDPSAGSRRFWGNCGTRMASNVTCYQHQYFLCTHGGVGGVPHTDADENSNGLVYEVGEPMSTNITSEQDQDGSKLAWNYVFHSILAAKAYEDNRPGYGPNPGKQPGKGTPPYTGGPSTGKPYGPPSSTRYTVVSGDSLSLISGKFWNDVLLWPIIYDNNKGTIGSNPNLIKPGQPLIIPKISAYSQGQLNDARARGRNWR